MASDVPGPPVRILSLDGGGVRGLSEILILKHIFEHLNEKLNRSPDDQLQPWQVFDLIGGTSTGGIIAVMLGRLRMSLDECERAYLSLSEEIFKPKQSSFNLVARIWDFQQVNPRFDAKILEDAMKATIRGVEEENALLRDEASCCKIFVVATQEHNTGITLLRSYKTPIPQVFYHEWKIWEACRATSAATGFFDPIEIGRFDQRFIDGAVGCNNPIDEAYLEAKSLWSKREPFILSLGTGSEPDGMKRIVTETEQTAERFYRHHKTTLVEGNLLFRFNVNQGLKQIGLHEYEQKTAIAVATQEYLMKGEVGRNLFLCVDRLSDLVLTDEPGSRPARSKRASPESISVTQSQSTSIIEIEQVTTVSEELDVQQPFQDLRYTMQSPLSNRTSSNVGRFLPSASPTTLRPGQLSPGRRITVVSEHSSATASFELKSSAPTQSIDKAFLKYIRCGEENDINIALAWLRSSDKRSQILQDSFNTALLEISQLKEMGGKKQRPLNFRKKKQRYGTKWMELVEVLLECMPDVNCKDPQSGLTPLIFAASDDVPGVIERLVDAGASLEATDPIDHRTPLMRAAENNHLSAARKIIQKIEEKQLFYLINATDLYGMTALAIASWDFGKESETAKLLSDHGGQLRGDIGSNGRSADLSAFEIEAPNVTNGSLTTLA